MRSREEIRADFQTLMTDIRPILERGKQPGVSPKTLAEVLTTYPDLKARYVALTEEVGDPD